MKPTQLQKFLVIQKIITYVTRDPDLLKIVNEKKIEEETKFLDAKEKELYIKLFISEISLLDKLGSEKLSKKL